MNESRWRTSPSTSKKARSSRGLVHAPLPRQCARSRPDTRPRHLQLHTKPRFGVGAHAHKRLPKPPHPHASESPHHSERAVLHRATPRCAAPHRATLPLTPHLTLPHLHGTPQPDITDFVIESGLGTGGFAAVAMVTHLKTGTVRWAQLARAVLFLAHFTGGAPPREPPFAVHVLVGMVAPMKTSPTLKFYQLP